MKISVSPQETGCFDEEMIRRIEGVMEGTLERFGQHLSTVEVLVSDPENPDHRSGMSCRVEAHLQGAAAVSAMHQAYTLAEAIHGAADKLKRSLIGYLRQRPAVGALPALPLSPALGPKPLMTALPAAAPPSH